MPVIRVSERTWQRMKANGEAFETPDEFINKAINCLEKSTSGRVHISEGRTRNAQQADIRATAPGSQRTKLPQREFRSPLIETVYELGGQASTAEIRPIMEQKMAQRLSAADYEPVSTGDPRWWNATCWERNDLVKEGLFRNDSPRGVWALSQRGIAAVENASSP